jgi:MATE family multidrug resistance protein
MIPMGVGSAASVRVSNTLGAGAPQAARRSARVAVSLTVGLQMVLASTLFFGRGLIPRIITNNAEVGLQVMRDIVHACHDVVMSCMHVTAP